jgi:hypothetical protein
LAKSVPRQIDQAALRGQLEEIDQLRPARRAADAREPRALRDGIDGGRLAGIRAAGKGDLTARVRRKLVGLGSAGQNFTWG